MRSEQGAMNNEKRKEKKEQRALSKEE